MYVENSHTLNGFWMVSTLNGKLDGLEELFSFDRRVVQILWIGVDWKRRRGE